jgi:hypothetical protein
MNPAWVHPEKAESADILIHHNLGGRGNAEGLNTYFTIIFPLPQ